MAGSRPLKVLVVDDEQVIADSLAAILNMQGYQTKTAYTGEEAAEIAETMRPDTVVSDVVMPGMSGLDLALWLKQNQPDCKLLLISGHPTATYLLEESSRRGHVFPILAKPVHPEEILRFVRTGSAA